MIRFEKVTKYYENTGQTALDKVSFHINKGEFCYIQGESGAGKSTLIKLILGMEKPTTGNIRIGGENPAGLSGMKLSGYRQKIGVIFQDYQLIQDRNVFQNVALAQLIAGKSSHIMQKQVSYILSLVGISNKFKAYPSQLSGGEQQKVCLARAIVNQPNILLADEPTGSLDPQSAEELINLLEVIHNRGTTVVMVTHNRELVERHPHSVITLNQGKVVSLCEKN